MLLANFPNFLMEPINATIHHDAKSWRDDSSRLPLRLYALPGASELKVAAHDRRFAYIIASSLYGILSYLTGDRTRSYSGDNLYLCQFATILMQKGAHE